MNQEHPINIRLIDHVVIRVQNLVRMIDFYCDVLGCRLERGPGKSALAQLRAGDSLIDLVDALGSLGRQGGGRPHAEDANVIEFHRPISPAVVGDSNLEVALSNIAGCNDEIDQSS